MTDTTEAAARVRAFCDAYDQAFPNSYMKVRGVEFTMDDLRELLAAHDAQAVEIARLRTALEWYDDPSSQGDVARAALKGGDDA